MSAEETHLGRKSEFFNWVNLRNELLLAVLCRVLLHVHTCVFTFIGMHLKY